MNISGSKFGIVGGGIGGLAAALTLRQRGAVVTVFEQAPELTEVGAGLQISANGMAVLRALKVVADTPEAGLLSHGTVLRDYRAGRLVCKIVPPSAGPTYYYHRADLLDLLYKAAVQKGVEFHLGARVERVRKHPSEAEITLDTGARFRVDCAVAADGGQSAIRADLTGRETPKFTHQVAWRATIPWDRRNKNPCAVLTMGPGRHVVTYPLRDQTLMNIVAIEERSDWQEEGWRLRGDPEELKARFAGFGGLVKEILQEVKDPNIWALFLRPVAECWQNGRVALLGDAAHPTLPFMAQGACLALEDAWTLGRSFEEQSGVSQALAAYEATRRQRATRVVAAAGANARNFHLRGPMRVGAQLALMAVGSRLGRKYDWIYEFDATA
ncbi:FAD-dependent monooxygenase [Ruegeria faecimaris]|uniref:Salicylate hydroxylase n=1 Tax=Ruegeria faecimaris TaxID=686389 RepID=A0A521ASM1_9RHOB|nr:FAD-dependent monooxygenase [Ruegeria faecimaris]SMO37838.1 salicylate hydroxylase [Ruegeria faecimaris]